jgi:hypothetical protein
MTTFTKGNKKLIIEQDTDIESPRAWDNLGTMVFLGNNKELGDKHNFDVYPHSFKVDEGTKELTRNAVIMKAKKLEKRSISLPVYMYSHSGETIATTPFSCPWDSGKIGFIYVTQKQAMEHLGWKCITKKRKAKLLEYLENEVKTLNQWLTGETYGYTLSEPNKADDSCWGFYGDDFNAIFDDLNENKEDWVEV